MKHQMNAKSQCAAILRHFRGGGRLTPVEAQNLYGCGRLAARVWDLKKDGYDVASEMVTTPGGARVARYRLIEEPRQLTLDDAA